MRRTLDWALSRTHAADGYYVEWLGSWRKKGGENLRADGQTGQEDWGAFCVLRRQVVVSLEAFRGKACGLSLLSGSKGRR